MSARRSKADRTVDRDAGGGSPATRFEASSLERHVAARIRSPSPAGGPVVVGVSGGVDSVVLLNALVACGGDVVGAHVNYGLRGEASDADERLVRLVCDRLDVPCLTLEAVDAPAASIQAWARKVRYDWFEQVAGRVSATAIAVAHHVEDQAETVLINIIRGTGLDGLRGMRPSRPIHRASDIPLIRPLLDLSRAEIEHYAATRGLSWREDASNDHERYLRTRVRSWLDGSNDLRDPRRLAVIARKADATAETLMSAVRRKGCPDPSKARDGCLDLPEEVLDRLPSVVRGWIVNRIVSELEGAGPQNRAIVEEVLDLIGSQPGRKVNLGNAVVWRVRDGLRFETSSPTADGDAPARTFRIGESVELPGGRLISERCEPPVPENIRLAPDEAIVDANRLSGKLVVRPWRSGDRLQPLGMQGTRKVKDVLTDRKVPVSDKAGVHVVVSGDDIVWIIGADTNHRYRITAGTVAAARLKFLVC